MLKNILLVGLGGFAGSVLRYLAYISIDKNLPMSWPLATFTVNIFGSLILGFIYGLLHKTTFVSQDTRLLLAVGFCGSFTTFSTFAFENLQMIQQKAFLSLISYTGLSLIIGIGAAYLGFFLAKMFS